jgi:hypothetical protein
MEFGNEGKVIPKWNLGTREKRATIKDCPYAKA